MQKEIVGLTAAASKKQSEIEQAIRYIVDELVNRRNRCWEVVDVLEGEEDGAGRQLSISYSGEVAGLQRAIDLLENVL